MKEVTRRQNALFMSITIHLIIIVLFTLLKIDFSPIDSSFIEVDFASKGTESMKAVPAINRSENSEISSGQTSKGNDNLKLPTRRLLAEDDESIFEDIEKVVTKDDSIPTAEKKLEKNNEGNFISRINSESQDKELKVTIAEDNVLSPGTPEVINEEGSGKSGVYEIQWEEGFKREIVYRVIPEFPESVDRSTKIILKFSVNPRGEVSSIIPLQKGDPQIENIAIKSFSNWRFNPIGSETIQWGRITFNFLIK